MTKQISHTDIIIRMLSWIFNVSIFDIYISTIKNVENLKYLLQSYLDEHIDYLALKYKIKKGDLLPNDPIFYDVSKEMTNYVLHQYNSIQFIEQSIMSYACIMGVKKDFSQTTKQFIREKMPGGIYGLLDKLIQKILGDFFKNLSIQEIAFMVEPSDNLFSSNKNPLLGIPLQNNESVITKLYEFVKPDEVLSHDVCDDLSCFFQLKLEKYEKYEKYKNYFVDIVDENMEYYIPVNEIINAYYIYGKNIDVNNNIQSILHKEDLCLIEPKLACNLEKPYFPFWLKKRIYRAYLENKFDYINTLNCLIHSKGYDCKQIPTLIMEYVGKTVQHISIQNMKNYIKFSNNKIIDEEVEQLQIKLPNDFVMGDPLFPMYSNGIIESFFENPEYIYIFEGHYAVKCARN